MQLTVTVLSIKEKMDIFQVKIHVNIIFTSKTHAQKTARLFFVVHKKSEASKSFLFVLFESK